MKRFSFSVHPGTRETVFVGLYRSMDNMSLGYSLSGQAMKQMNERESRLLKELDRVESAESSDRIDLCWTEKLFYKSQTIAFLILVCHRLLCLHFVYPEHVFSITETIAA